MGNQLLTNFTVLRRLHNPQSMLPLRSTHVAASDGEGSSAGFLATGSEDCAVRVFDLDGFTQQCLTAHNVPVVDVVVADGVGLMASGDVHGFINLWRRGP